MRNIQKAKKSPVSIKIVGLILSESYQKCKLFAQRLRKHYNKKFVEPSIKGYLEMDWVGYLNRLRKDIGGQTWAVRKGVVVFLDGVFLGGEEELFTRYGLYIFEQPTQEKIKKLAKHEYLSYLNQNNLLYTFFELSLDGEYMGSLLFELRPDLLPKTAVWFAMICDPHNNLGYSYKHSRIHRVCKRGWFQGGKLGLSSSKGFLEDESFCYKHDRRGILSMANYGKDSNRAQFFVTFKPSEWMDEYYVAFGRVVEGSDVLRRLEYTKCTYEHPDHDITVDNCGIVGVGLGKQLVTRKKLKGLTVGEPHIHLETFMDLVMDRFSEILFERLDEEVKKRLKGEWMEEMLWNAIQPQLINREPIADTLDAHDTSSKVLDPAMFIKGMYSLQEIPDHFIMGLLDGIIYDSVDMVDTREMAVSIVNLIINNLNLEGRHREQLNVENFVTGLVSDVNSVVYGLEELKMATADLSSISKKELFRRSVYKVASQTPTIRKLLTGYSTFSVSQASCVEEEVSGPLMVKASTYTNKERFQKSAQKIASMSTIRKLLTDYKSISVSQISDLEGEGEEHKYEEISTASALRGSIQSVASHSSTVRKLMTDYRRFSESRTKSTLAGDDGKRASKRSSTRESVIAHIWETLFRALFKEEHA